MLLDANQYNERFSFEFQASKAVVADGPVPGPDGATTKCVYPKTRFSATIWTRQAADAMFDGTEPDFDTKFAPWPYRIEVEQMDSGSSRPLCTDITGENPIELAEPDDEGTCSCVYSNFDLDVQSVHIFRRLLFFEDWLWNLGACRVRNLSAEGGIEIPCWCCAIFASDFSCWRLGCWIYVVFGWMHRGLISRYHFVSFWNST